MWCNLIIEVDYKIKLPQKIIQLDTWVGLFNYLVDYVIFDILWALYAFAIQLKFEKSVLIIMGNFVENIILMMKMELWYSLVVGTHNKGKNKDGKRPFTQH